MICCIRSKRGDYWLGPLKDSGVTWGSPVDAWLLEDEKAARRALRGLSGPSATEAEVVQAPAAALVGGEASEATDGELEVALDNVTRPRKRYRIIQTKRSSDR